MSALVAEHRQITLVGSGGCGKTRLAIEVASRQVGLTGRRVFWVDLGSIDDERRVVDAVAAGIGLVGHNQLDADHVVAHLGAHDALVVFDNCEHVLDATSEVVDAIHQRCSRVHLIATSREPLALRDEVVFHVPPLGLPEEETLEALLTSESGQLLVDRIRRARPGYVPVVEEQSALTSICVRLDGIPLALELAAARSATLAPNALAARLSERFRLLTGGGRNVLPRQRTLEASVAWSYHLLDDRDAAVFRQLSVFAGTFSLAAAVAAVGDDAGTEAEVTEVILGLVARSLLVGVGRDAEPRFRMLDTLRHFGNERLIDADEAEGARTRHLEWFLAAAHDAGPALEGPDALAITEALDEDLDNLRAAMSWAIDSDRADHLLAIAANLSWFWIWRGRLQEGLGWLKSADALDTPPSPQARLERAWACEQLAIHFRAGHDEISHHANTALTIAREIGDRRTEGRMLVSWGMHVGFRDPQDALQLIETGREICRTHDDPFWAAYATGSTALCRSFLGRHDQAAQHLDAMDREVNLLGNPQLVADHLARRSFIDFWRGDFDAVIQARARVDEVVAGLTEINVRAILVTNAAHVAIARGQAADSLVVTDALFDRYLGDGEYQHLPGILLGSVAALIALDRGSEAAERLDQMWQFPELRATVPYRLWFRQARAVAAYSIGAIDDALERFHDAVGDAQHCGSNHDAALAERFIAAIERSRGDHGAAQARLHRALEVHHNHGYPQPLADVIEELAAIEHDNHRSTAAATLLGAARTIRESAGVVCRIGIQSAFERDLAAVADTLGPTTYTSADKAGASMTIDEVIAFARRGRGARSRTSFGWSSLTPTETNVAELAAQGLTNAQIGDQLIMGRETVKSHIASIYRKLTLKNRAELAAAMARRQQTPPSG